MPADQQLTKNPVLDTSLQGDAARWEEIKYYMGLADDHSRLFDKAFFKRAIFWLVDKLEEKDNVDRQTDSALALDIQAGLSQIVSEQVLTIQKWKARARLLGLTSALLFIMLILGAISCLTH